MKLFTTAQRLNQLMVERNIRQVDILESTKPFCEKYDIKLSKNHLSQYVSGKTDPGQDKLTVLGLALNVSEVWLMGFDVPRERNIKPITSSSDGRISECVELFTLLSEEQKDFVIASIKGLLSAK